jgi:hypothetical protein
MSANCCDCEGITNPCDPCELCCPYSADLLGIGYIENDLPDSLIIQDFGTLNNQINPAIATRTGTTYRTEPITFDVLGRPVTTTFEVNREYDETEERFVWRFEGCLFYVLAESPTDYSKTVWRDRFLDTYTVITASGDFPIIRRSLCSWSGFDPNYGPTGSNVTLLLNPASAGRPRNALWTFAGFARQDAGPYNSPLGTYSSSIYTWTVTA